jgi:hypothetical protein
MKLLNDYINLKINIIFNEWSDKIRGIKKIKKQYLCHKLKNTHYVSRRISKTYGSRT